MARVPESRVQSATFVRVRAFSRREHAGIALATRRPRRHPRRAHAQSRQQDSGSCAFDQHGTRRTQKIAPPALRPSSCPPLHAGSQYARRSRRRQRGRPMPEDAVGRPQGHRGFLRMVRWVFRRTDLMIPARPARSLIATDAHSLSAYRDGRMVRVHAVRIRAGCHIDAG